MNTEAMECLERWYRQAGPDLLAYLRQRHGTGTVAEDLLQDTFIQAMKHPERIRNAESPRAYLFGIARNLSLEAYRQLGPERELTALVPESMAAPAPPAQHPRVEAMREAIAALAPAPREILLLRLQQELSYEEIARVMAIPVGTVRSRLHLAVRKLREKLHKTQPFDL